MTFILRNHTMYVSGSEEGLDKGHDKNNCGGFFSLWFLLHQQHFSSQAGTKQSQHRLMLKKQQKYFPIRQICLPELCGRLMKTKHCDRYSLIDVYCYMAKSQALQFSCEDESQYPWWILEEDRQLILHMRDRKKLDTKTKRRTKL